MVARGGVEPPTFRFSVGRSYQLSYLALLDAGCLFSVDSDAHAPGQLDFLIYGCARAERIGVPVETIVNTWPKDRLLAWANPT